MGEVTTVGLDIAKSVFQAHGKWGHVPLLTALRRAPSLRAGKGVCVPTFLAL